MKFKAPTALKQKISSTVKLTGNERTFAREETIVSKTDLKGTLTYVNDVFLRLASLDEGEAIGAAHSVIRHPDMPRAIFKLLWERLSSDEEIFAYVVNLAANGDHYWVLAHVTPSHDGKGAVIGYHSSRRCASKEAIAVITPLYAELKRIEDSASSRVAGLEASCAHLQNAIASKGMSYDQFVFSLPR